MSFVVPVEPNLSPYKRFDEPVDGIVYSWCPTMDLLVVTVNGGKNVKVYRMKGQKVWNIAISEGITTSVTWRPDGKQIAILTSKNQCLIYDTNTAKLLTTLKGKDSDASFVSWVCSSYSGKRNKFSGIYDDDLTKALPKLPPLPNGNSTNSAFATKQAIDGLIQNNKLEDLDLLLLFSDTKVDVTLHGLFSLAPVEILDSANENGEDIVNHISNNIQDHYFITSSFTTMKHRLRHFKTNFNENYQFVQYVTITSSKIIALTTYLEEVFTFTSHEIKNYLDLNNRFVSILKDELTKKDESVIDELYNLLLTGMMNDEVKDWLENTIGDRGVKRWAKMGDSTFDNVRRTIIYHLIPSCERLIILFTHLDAITKSSIVSGSHLELAFLNESLESVKKFLKILFEFIIKINREQQLFNSFIAWINFTLKELQEEEAEQTFKTSEVSDFINNHLERSVLLMLIPNFRRLFNEIRINSSDLFDSIRTYIRKGISVTNLNIELGRVTEKQHLQIIDDELYVLTHYENQLNIYRIDLLTNFSKGIIVSLDEEILDLQVDNGELFVLFKSKLVSFIYPSLFNTPSDSFSQHGISLSNTKDLSNIVPKYITINGNRNMGCLISEDLQKFFNFFINEESS